MLKELSSKVEIQASLLFGGIKNKPNLFFRCTAVERAKTIERERLCAPPKSPAPIISYPLKTSQLKLVSNKEPDFWSHKMWRQQSNFICRMNSLQSPFTVIISLYPQLTVGRLRLAAEVVFQTSLKIHS